MASQKKKQAGQTGFDGNDELRNKVVQFTVSPSEYIKLLELYSKSTSSTLAYFCREKSLLSVPTNNKKHIISNHALEMFHLSKIGNNINQIAKKINSGESKDNIICELREELEELRKIKTRMIRGKL